MTGDRKSATVIFSSSLYVLCREQTQDTQFCPTSELCTKDRFATNAVINRPRNCIRCCTHIESYYRVGVRLYMSVPLSSIRHSLNDVSFPARRTVLLFVS